MVHEKADYFGSQFHGMQGPIAWARWGLQHLAGCGARAIIAGAPPDILSTLATMTCAVQTDC